MEQSQLTVSHTSVYVKPPKVDAVRFGAAMTDADDTDADYRERVLAAYRARCDAEGVRLIRDAEIARRMVAADPSLKIGYHQAGRLLGGTRSRHRPTMIALAKVLGVDPGWLDYGPASAAPAPPFAPRQVAPSVQKIAPTPVDEARRRHAAKKSPTRRRRSS
jgi:hypothetical protein